MAKDESEITQDQVWDEHLKDVNVPLHWAYVLGVLGGGFLVMVALMALLAGGGG